MNHSFLQKLSRAAQISIIFGLMATIAFAQSGDISGATSNFTTLASSVLKLLVVVAGFAFVGLLIWGGLTLTTNRPRGLAMVGGGLVGAALMGVAYLLVNTLTGHTVSTSELMGGALSLLS